MEDRATPPSPLPPADGGAPVALRVAMAILAVAVLGSWLLLAVVHVDDGYNVGWVEGSRMALARSAGSGVLYPPLFDGERYGGTRFMPLPILLHAGVARLSGEYLASGKVVAYVSVAVLLGLVFVVLRRMPVSVPAAGVLTAGVLATRPGLLAATTVQGDALSVAFQLGAVALVASSRRPRAVPVAAALCTLAISSKLSAVWAPLAIITWLAVRDRRRLVPFAVALTALLAGTFALLQVVTEGRFLANLTEVAFAGVGGPASVFRSPVRLLELAADAAPLLVVLAPFALVAEPVLAGVRDVSIYYAALLMAIVTLLVVLSDSGTDANHLLDVTVLSLVVVGRVWSLAAGREPARASLRPILAFAVLFAVAVSALLMMRVDVRAAAVSLIRAETMSASEDLAAVVRPRDTLLAEDPSVPVSLGRTPVVLDAWVLLRTGRNHPDWIEDLVARIRHRAFDKIVLVYPVSFQAWYQEIHFGHEVAQAIRDSYRLVGSRAGYYVYIPAPGPDSAVPGSGTG